MLIGKFAQKYGVKPDTIRYYMDLGLLIPKKRNHYYHFDKTCEEDMEIISELKKYRFSLQEIHKFLSFKRVTLLSNKEDFTFLTQMLEEKKEELDEEIQNISYSIQEIDKKVEKLNLMHTLAGVEKGMPFEFLSMLYCPSCQVSLDLRNASTRGQQLFMGELFCSCGYKAQVHEGIVITEHLNKESFNPHYIYDREMLKIIQSSFISLSERASLWVKEYLTSEDLADKVIVETHIDTYVFLNKYISELDKSAFYIFSGSTMPMLKMLKSKIEQTNPGLKILYLLNSGLDLPIKHKAIDYMIDSYSFNEYCLFHQSLPMKTLSPYLKDDGKIIGASFYYHDGAKSLSKMKTLHPNACRANLRSYFIKDNLEAGNFQIIEKEDIGSTIDPGSYIKYHVPGETGYFLTYMASK
ncbi:MerR family transcriptional regulator [Siminovitchia acidinfaciens]|uniref:MerR family transcriptional regulator n=1 Tax=Siminovitchia acidinfaciens TaxID=2321395 RepID=A0A429XT48_9BACI|nr:MerR family transcriptional regulator [Siminovitchia acidinfaciens]RST70822.1 MerR family transcriptional regulator [Siminovitchia acidinfaciens]